MIGPSVFKISVSLLGCMALAGCLNSGSGGGVAGGGGGGGGGATASQHDTRVAALNSAIASTNVPTSGTASYAGSVKADLNEAATTIGSIMGDLEMQIDFGAAFADSAAQSVSGRISNLRGTINDTEFASETELTTQEALARGFRSTMNINQTAVMGQTITTGSVAARFVQDLAINDVPGELNLGLVAGIPRGDAAASIVGSVQGVWVRPGGISDYNAVGTWYADRQ